MTRTRDPWPSHLSGYLYGEGDGYLYETKSADEYAKERGVDKGTGADAPVNIQPEDE